MGRLINETNVTPEKRAKFLKSLRTQANISAACKAAGISRPTVYRWREDDADFAAEWNVAVEEACDQLEGAAWRRARKDSDTLLIFLLKAHRPEKYRETVKQEHSGETRLIIEYRRNWRRQVGPDVDGEAVSVDAC